MPEPMSEYEKEMLEVEKGRTRIEILKLIVLPFTILVTILVAWLQINAANARNDLAASNQFEVSLMRYIESSKDKCVAKDLFIKMYEHHANKVDVNKNGTYVWQWYYNYKKILEEQCPEKQ